MAEPACVFCAEDDPQVFYEGRLVRGRWDDFPATPGHALLITRRHVRSWFEASPEERAELAEATFAARQAIEAQHQPRAYNVLVNVGSGAGQTVPHLHLHLIPHYGAPALRPIESGEAVHQRVIDSLRAEILTLRQQIGRMG